MGKKTISQRDGCCGRSSEKSTKDLILEEKICGIS